MNTSAGKIIRGGLGLLGIVSPGEALKASDASDGLAVLNSLLDAWKLERLYAYATATIQHTTVGETASLTIGPTGDIVVAERPERFEDGCFYRSNGGIDYPLTQANEADYNRVPFKAVTTLSPTGFEYTPSYPVGRLQFYPRIPSGVVLNLIVQQRISAFADVNTEYDLPAGYERALRFTFAEEVAANYEREIPPTVARNAQQARRLLKRSNFSVPQLQVSETEHRVERWRSIY